MARVTVLGGGGGAGGAIVRALHVEGHEVTAVTRRGDAAVPEGVARLAGDVETGPGAKQACAGADVVVMAAQPPYAQWTERFPAMLDHVIAGCEAAAARLVMVDNLYAYAPAQGPITEASPEHATDRKGLLRRSLAESLLGAHAAGRVRVTIGRAGDFFGPAGGDSAPMQLGVLPALDGKAMRGAFDLDQPHTFAYLPDVGAAFARLVADDRADGRAWVLPAAPAITQRALLELVNAALETPVPIRVIGPRMMRIGALFNPDAREMLVTRPQWDRPFVADGSAFQQTFGPLEVTPHADAIAATVAWHRAGRPTP